MQRGPLPVAGRPAADGSVARTRPLAAAFRRWTAGIARRRLATRDEVDIDGLEHLAAALREGPVVAAPNHVCWWDALVILHLSDRLGVDMHVVVDQDSLERYPFFRAAGCIGVDRSSPMAARHGLARARRLLEAGALVWVFPQGRYRPSHARPLGLEGGAAWLAARSGAALVPVGLCYPFLQGSTPAAFVTVGPPVAPEALEAGLVAAIDAGEARAEVRRFAVMPRPDLASRLLGWLVGGVDRG